MQIETKKKAEVTILISDKMDLKTKAITRDKGHHIILTGSIQQENITSINIYATQYRSIYIHKENLSGL